MGLPTIIRLDSKDWTSIEDLSQYIQDNYAQTNCDRAIIKLAASSAWPSMTQFAKNIRSFLITKGET